MSTELPPRGGPRHPPRPVPPRDRTLASSLDEYLTSQGYGEARRLAAISACWAEVVGPEVAAHVTPRALREGRLVVSVDHPAWGTELAFLAQQILSSLAERLGEGVAGGLEITVLS
ncbi:MAG TPA: DUF721 domain-containing protein [Acidimicrobiales bacterium]|nr:DUF721 domain-containing protein [Acidimicrobiales bacterium]